MTKKINITEAINMYMITCLIIAFHRYDIIYNVIMIRVYHWDVPFIDLLTIHDNEEKRETGIERYRSNVCISH